METKYGSYGSFLDRGFSVEINVKYSDDNAPFKLDKDKVDDILYMHYQNIMADIQKYIITNDPDAIQRRENTLNNLKQLFDSPVYIKEIPNEYWNRYTAYSWASPWLLVTTAKGVIKIGWRSSVIHIEWSESDVTVKAEDLFTEENVTKFDRTIHAWGYDKAKEYLERILS